MHVAKFIVFGTLEIFQSGVMAQLLSVGILNYTLPISGFALASSKTASFIQLKFNFEAKNNLLSAICLLC